MTIFAENTVTTGQFLAVLGALVLLGLAIWLWDWFKRWSTRGLVNQLASWIEGAERAGHRGGKATTAARSFLQRAQSALKEGNFDDAADLAILGRKELDCLRAR